MITKRASADRGHMKWSWLNAKHTFSFGSYFDPKWMGFSKLRVINEDVIDEGMGFDTHPHQDMEILSFILDGAIEHKDTLGNHSVIKPGEIQIMSAGTGIQHSEFNPNKDQKTHMLQIWIEPDHKGIVPRYEQYKYEVKVNDLITIASSEGGENIAKVYQDVVVENGVINQGQVQKELNPSRKYWMQVYAGAGEVNGESVSQGDAVAISEEKSLKVLSDGDLKFLLFDLL